MNTPTLQMWCFKSILRQYTFRASILPLAARRLRDQAKLLNRLNEDRISTGKTVTTTMSAPEQSRVILWAPPRSLSTAFLKCMTAVPNSKMFYEPFISAYQFGPERITGEALSAYYPEDLKKRCGDLETSDTVFEDSLCTYQYVKQLLETSYPDKQLVFSKDMFHSLAGRYEFIPRGYRHIFLIRNPVNVFPSWRSMIQDVTSVRNGSCFQDMPVDVAPRGLSFKEGFELFNHIKDARLDPDPVIIDGDDLLQRPHVILSACCRRVGIPYIDDLLSWTDDDNMADAWTASAVLKHIIKQDVPCFRSLKQSCGLGKQHTGAHGMHLSAMLSDDHQRCVDMVMPYYNAMYANRLTC